MKLEVIPNNTPIVNFATGFHKILTHTRTPLGQRFFAPVGGYGYGLKITSTFFLKVFA